MWKNQIKEPNFVINDSFLSVKVSFISKDEFFEKCQW